MKFEKLFLIFIGILLVGFVLSSPPTWQGSGVNYTMNEDSFYYHNLSKNISNYDGNVNFSIDADQSISWTNSSGKNSVSKNDVSGWIFIADANTGNLTINATFNNQTGFFEVPIQATNTTDSEGSITIFEFMLNATNDAPSFTNINNTYNLTQDNLFYEHINATDQEEQYPLYFNISFFNNCTHASWSGRNSGENCSILNLTNIVNTSSLMNITPVRNEVGTYWANISVRDYGENYSCPHNFCDPNEYEENKTTYHSVVEFNVFASLDINASNCTDKIFTENESGVCYINITTKGDSNSLNISSLAILRNYEAGSVTNTSWFFPSQEASSSSFIKEITINVTPEKTEIGNWTINFTVQDLTSSESATEQIHVYVNRTLNDVPSFESIPDTNTSMDLDTRINITVYDDDLLVPDKNQSYGGYNETMNFTVLILNQTNLSQELVISDFDVEILSMPVAGTNRTEAKIQFTPNSSEVGDYTINITVNDSENSSVYDEFNLSIISNSFPSWNQTSYSFDLVVNSTLATTTNFGAINLSDGYVTDAGDTLTFTNNSSALPSFSMSSAGIINFTPLKGDVGDWTFTVTATDSLGLENTTTFNFNVTNVNSAPVIETPISVVNATVFVSSNITAVEDNYTTISLWVQDDDFKISTNHKDYYNESLNVDLTIEGNNTNLFSFSTDSSFPLSGQNRSRNYAIFTPNSTDVGEYNITINVTDESGSFDTLEFNLTVTAVNDLPTLVNISNKTSAVNRTFYYDLNATDEEDGSDSQENLRFNITFLEGDDFINGNETIFNTTTGVLNIVFNDSQAGIYKLNVTVNDTSNAKDSEIFWITVYDLPTVTFPVSNYNFSLEENVTSNLTFQVNHTVLDNLTYEIYVNDILRENTSYYGNGTNLTWEFTPNFTDETYGEYKNLTLVVYPTNSELLNKTEINATINRNVNITHANAPVVFSGYIGSSQVSYDNNIEINLTSYFSDIDYSDVNYNQTINFSVSSNSSPSYITSSVSGWTLTLSSLIAVKELINITATDSITNVTSNSFEIEFTTPTTVSTPTPSSGGGSSTIPVSLKIIVPEPLSASKGERIVLPITLYNNGKKTLYDISLSSVVAKDNVVDETIGISFDKTNFSALYPEQKENVTLTMDINTEDLGVFEVTINANVKSPKYDDWGKLYITIRQGDDVMERLIFTQEFLQENPECVELEEILDEAREFFRQGDFVRTILKINQAIAGCKNSISQQARVERRDQEEDPLYRYLLIATLVTFLFGVIYYSYHRMKLKRSLREGVLEKSKNAPAVFFIIGLISFIFVSRFTMTGFAVNQVNASNPFNFNLIFVLGIMLVGVFVFLIREKISKFVNEAKNKRKVPKDKIKKLIKKSVYTQEGDYVGKIEEVILGKYKIDSLLIKLGKKIKKENKLRIKGFNLKYNCVKDVGHIVIIKHNLFKTKKIINLRGENENR